MFSDPAVFISYRHIDTFAVALYLTNTLIRRLGNGCCYLDTADDGYGNSIEASILHHLTSAKVLLALIGPAWHSATDKDGDKRLLNRDDLVRRELELASQHKRLVIPVLVDGVEFSTVAAWLKEKVPSLAFLADLRRYEIKSDAPHLQPLLDRISKETGIPLRPDTEMPVAAFKADAVRRALAEQFPLHSCYEITNAGTPFVGLGCFTEQDSPLFFGRTSETLALCRSVRHFRVALLYGQSGVGKSSLLHAGLLPRLEGTNPSIYLRRDKSIGYHEQLASLLAQRGGQATVAVLDQLEEIYTDRREDWRNEEAAFWNTLARALSASPSLKVVLSFRAEHYPEIRAALTQRQLLLTVDQELHLRPLDRDGLREAIYGVADDPQLRDHFRLRIDQDLAAVLSSDLLDEGRPESHIGPLLQYHLRKLWDDALSRRGAATDWIQFTTGRYMSLRRRTLDDLLDDQLARLEPDWQSFLANGLALDLLYCYTTDSQTATIQADQDVLSRYGHIERFQGFFECVKNRLLLLLPLVTSDRPGARLAHDSLAPVIRQRFQSSNMSGQRACRLVGAKSRAGGQTVTFSESDIETIRSGLFGMSRVPADIMAQIVADEEKYSRQEQDQLNLAIRSAQASLEHLRFEECLRHLQWAISAGRVDERIWEIASQLPYPLNQAGETAVLKETMELLEGRGLGPADEEAMAARFYPVMVGVMGGDFKMGSHEGYSDEEPVRSVHLHGFDMSVTLVTWWQFGLFCLLTGREVPNDAGFGRGDRPAINVSWHDAVDYCIWLSERIGQVDGRGLQQVYTRVGKTVTAEWSNNGYRLPTEAEWEYAAREMGRPVRFGNGMDVADPTLMNFNSELELNELKPDWYRRAKSQQATTPVRTYRPNALGLYDMSGNVYEWCWDWWSAGEHGFYLTSDGVSDPVGSASGERRTIRGGSWLHVANLCRCTGRWRYQPEYRFNCIGFRVVRRHAVLSSG